MTGAIRCSASRNWASQSINWKAPSSILNTVTSAGMPGRSAPATSANDRARAGATVTFSMTSLSDIPIRIQTDITLASEKTGLQTLNCCRSELITWGTKSWA